MDDQRFDQLTRSLAAGTTRRRVIKGLGGGLVAGVVALVSGGGTEAAACQRPKTRCGKGRNAQCIDTSTDPNNCGGCGIACFGDTCRSATCSGGTCQYTPQNEGSGCFTAGGAGGEGGVCTAGTCVPNGGTCLATFQACQPSDTCCNNLPCQERPDCAGGAQFCC